MSNEAVLWSRVWGDLGLGFYVTKSSLLLIPIMPYILCCAVLLNAIHHVGWRICFNFSISLMGSCYLFLSPCMLTCIWCNNNSNNKKSTYLFDLLQVGRLTLERARLFMVSWIANLWSFNDILGGFSFVSFAVLEREFMRVKENSTKMFWSCWQGEEAPEFLLDSFDFDSQGNRTATTVGDKIVSQSIVSSFATVTVLFG